MTDTGDGCGAHESFSGLTKELLAYIRRSSCHERRRTDKFLSGFWRKISCNSGHDQKHTFSLSAFVL